MPENLDGPLDPPAGMEECPRCAGDPATQADCRICMGDGEVTRATYLEVRQSERAERDFMRGEHDAERAYNEGAEGTSWPASR